MIALYIPSWDAASMKFFMSCRPEQYVGSFMIFQTVADLRKRLFEATHDLVVLILLIDNQACLQDLASLREYLVDIKTIVVLPDDESDTLSLGYTFFPNYITNLNGSLRDFNGVIGRMVEEVRR